MFICLQNCLNISYGKFIPTSELSFLGSQNLANIFLADLTRSSTLRLSAFYYKEVAVVIYNTQMFLIVNTK